MFPSVRIQEGWESPFHLELDLEFCPNEECLNVFKILRSGCTSDCDADIIYLTDIVISRIHEKNYSIKTLDRIDPFFILVRNTFQYLNSRKYEEVFNSRRIYIHDIFNNYLKNEPLDISPHPVSPTSPPTVETKSKIKSLKLLVKEVSVPKIMKKAKKQN